MDTAFLDTLLAIYIYVLLAAALLSWLIGFKVVTTDNRMVAAINDILTRATEPVCRPTRWLLSDLGGVDVSPVLLIGILVLLRYAIAIYADVPPGIRVVSGTYGGNCEARLTGSGTTDKTWHLRRACDGKYVCEYRIDWQTIGDPAVGCGKDYVAVWQCLRGGSGTARAEPEAGMGSKIVLSCNRWPWPAWPMADGDQR